MNEEFDLNELIEKFLDFREILEAYEKVPESKKSECKSRMIAIAETLANSKKWS